MKKWTESEIKYLIDNYNCSSNVELCEYFGISRGTLTKKARELRVEREAKWSKKKEEYLRANYNKKTLSQLAKEMEISTALIRQKKFQLNLTLTRKDSKWTKSSVVRKIDTLFSENFDISASNVKKKCPSLYSMARNYYKSWNRAVQASGLDYNRIRKDKNNISWSKEMVLEKIRLLADNKEILSSKYNSVNQKKLWNAANHYFYSWRNAVEAANINYEKISEKILDWSAEKVKSEILRIYQNDLPLFASYAKKNYVALYGAASTFNGGWKQAIEKAGIDYSQVNKRASEIDWSPFLIKKSILEIDERGEDLCESIILRKQSSLRTAARRIFGSWERAIEYAGLKIDKVRKDINSEAYKGHIFEELVYETLLATGRNISRLNYIVIKNKIYIPDFIDNNSGMWIDAKLSSWGNGVEPTVTKYLQAQDELEIIYLKSGDRNIENVKFTWVKDYYPKLRSVGRVDLIEKIDSII